MWEIEISNSARKQVRKLPEKIKDLLDFLLEEIEIRGPVRKNWPHFSSLTKKKGKISAHAYHCHLKKGRPTYVACWKQEDKKIKIVEVFYVGTHENAPY